MYIKDPASYSVDEVCLFLNAIGLGDKAGEFRIQSVDGSLLVALTPEDFAELGVSGLQGKKIVNAIEFTKSLASGGGGGGGSDARVAQLEAENAQLKRELAYYQPAKAPAPAPAAYAPAPAPRPPQHNEHVVIKSTARGAARGAVLGAVAGAITGDPGQGAKIGAAVGATGGAMNGLGARRRARLLR
ncbi:hypothetical protein FisN_1Hh149 [Fistulifera solaris]|uniref:SAM domain-containing protein n=1 Tax=Fistulifera solaris TaxID=1519565 RepID=A0A1Z5JDX2_FISSO|nr:hypothetical protein FisN_1Hh149 [Fistulifera solaris]|eukprot:GAX12220.1 hypothetical protein FisN_1Hh149 [Fistulifera solaris]